MKKLFSLTVITAVLFSCSNPETENNTNPEFQKLSEENQKLKEETAKKEEEINSFIESFNEIQKNLDEIKEREKLVAVNTSDPELQNSKKQEIADDINLINELLVKNKEKISALNKKLKKANLKIEELEKMIERLTKQLEDKDTEIASLKETLEKANAAYKDLFVEYNARLDEIENQTNKMNTAFYAYGSSKELKEKGVLTKEGGFIGIGKAEKLKDDFNKEYFTQIDIMEVKSIVLACKKAKLITSHPTSSYKFEGPEGKVEKLVITNPENFWGTSKYLVIVTE